MHFRGWFGVLLAMALIGVVDWVFVWVLRRLVRAARKGYLKARSGAG